MADDRDERHERAEMLTLAAAGEMAGGVAAELTAPLRELRESLAVIVEKLDRHILEAQGPTPYPWDDTKAMRERVAQAYLVSRRVARLTTDLANAITTFGKRPEVVDVNKLVEVAVNLSRHRVSADTELFIDFGKVPATRLAPGALILVLARLVTVAADSAHGVQGAAVSVKTRAQRERGGDWIAIYVADSGSGRPDEAESAIAIGRDVAESLGGSFEGQSEAGTGSVFELHLPVVR